MLLPLTNLPAIVFIGKNKIGLDPGYSAASINQQFPNSTGIDTAIFIELFSAFFDNGLNSTFHGDASRSPQKVESFFIPQIDSGLKADLHPPLRYAFQQTPDVFADTEDLINEIDVF